MSYLVKNYNRKKISFMRGKGSYLFSTNGKKYLDFVQGIAVNSLGHAHPKLVQVLKIQSKNLACFKCIYNSRGRNVGKENCEENIC